MTDSNQPVKATDGGATLSVRVQPRASRNQIEGVRDGALRVRLTAPPVDSAANQALVQLLAKTLGIPRGAITIIRGHKNRSKLLAIADLTPDEVAARLGLR